MSSGTTATPTTGIADSTVTVGVVDGSDAGSSVGEVSTAGLTPDVGQPVTCQVEEFEDVMLEGWEPWTAGNPYEIADGHFTVTMSSTEIAAGGISGTNTGFTDALFEAVWVQFPESVQGAQVLMGIGTGTDSAVLVLEADSVFLRHFVNDAATDGERVPFDATWTHWRVRTDPSGLVFEVGDGASWNLLGALEPSFDLALASPFIFIGTWKVTPMPGIGQVESVSLCTAS